MKDVVESNASDPVWKQLEALEHVHSFLAEVQQEIKESRDLLRHMNNRLSPNSTTDAAPKITPEKTLQRDLSRSLSPTAPKGLLRTNTVGSTSTNPTTASVTKVPGLQQQTQMSLAHDYLLPDLSPHYRDIFAPEPERQGNANEKVPKNANDLQVLYTKTTKAFSVGDILQGMVFETTTPEAHPQLHNEIVRESTGYFSVGVENLLMLVVTKDPEHVKAVLEPAHSVRPTSLEGSRNDNTPIRSSDNKTIRPTKRPALSSPSSKEDAPLTCEGIRIIIDDALKSHLSELIDEFSAKMRAILDIELRQVKDELQDVKQAMQFVNEQFEDIEREHKTSQICIKNLQEQNTFMLSNITDLKSRINQLEQGTRSRNIEIQCLPEKKSENLVSIVKELGKTISCEIKDENIMRITRTAKINPENSRPRSIIVELNSSNKRDQFLVASINYNRANPTNRLNSSHAGCSGAKLPIYITEHLSPSNKSLHAAARRVAKEKGYSNYDIIVLTETWLNSSVLSTELFDDRYVVYRRDRESSGFHPGKEGGGVLVAVSRRLRNLPYCTVSAAQDSLTKIDPLHPPLEANISIVDSKDLNINSNNRKLNYYKADYEAIRGALSGIDWNSELAECTNVNSMAKRDEKSFYPGLMTDGISVSSDGDGICNLFASMFSQAYDSATSDDKFTMSSGLSLETTNNRANLHWLEHPMTDILHSVIALLEPGATDIAEIQVKANLLWTLLKNRRAMLGEEVNGILDFADGMVKEEDGERIFDRLDDFLHFPNVSTELLRPHYETGRDLCKALIQAFNYPFSYKTVDRQRLVNSANAALKDHFGEIFQNRRRAGFWSKLNSWFTSYDKPKSKRGPKFSQTSLRSRGSRMSVTHRRGTQQRSVHRHNKWTRTHSQSIYNRARPIGKLRNGNFLKQQSNRNKPLEIYKFRTTEKRFSKKIHHSAKKLTTKPMISRKKLVIQRTMDYTEAAGEGLQKKQNKRRGNGVITSKKTDQIHDETPELFSKRITSHSESYSEKYISFHRRSTNFGRQSDTTQQGDLEEYPKQLNSSYSNIKLAEKEKTDTNTTEIQSEYTTDSDNSNSSSTCSDEKEILDVNLLNRLLNVTAEESLENNKSLNVSIETDDDIEILKHLKEVLYDK
ncbi:unnamed protein product [Arctia plantaginis]|uniref:Uncharacterized protein n=1 Tax=Arctia plantaginis TaxID=874455 RepID=A0A8S1ASD1_ARCPL|nr:unnamed protein product [Arctia plantaginis]